MNCHFLGDVVDINSMSIINYYLKNKFINFIFNSYLQLYSLVKYFIYLYTILLEVNLKVGYEYEFALSVFSFLLLDFLKS